MSELIIDVSGAVQLASKFAGAKPILEGEIKTAMVRSLAQMQGEIQAAAPVWQGTARRSVTVTTPSPYVGKVGTNLVHAIVQLETGRRAGAPAPPPGSLLAWMSSKGIPAESEFAVARAISRRGIPARHLFTDTFHRNEGAIRAEFAAALQRFIAKMRAR